MELSGKELAPINGTIKKRGSKPTLITVGKHLRSSDGHWNTDNAATYVLEHAREKFIQVGALANVFYYAQTIDTKKKVRKNLFNLRSKLLDQGELLVTKTSESKQVVALKIYNPNDPEERANIEQWLEAMAKRKELTVDQFARAMHLVAHKEREVETTQ